MYRSPKTTDVERSRVIAYIPLFVASVMFWAIAEQGSTILAIYADKRTLTLWAFKCLLLGSNRLIHYSSLYLHQCLLGYGLNLGIGNLHSS